MNESSKQPSAELTRRERLIALVRRILGQPQGTRPLPIDARLSDLGMSSIKMVNFMLAVEVEFNLTIPQDQITPEHFESIAAVEAMLTALLAS